MVTFQQNLVRFMLIVMSILTLGYSLFWDGWSFSGPLLRYSAWLQPTVFLFGMAALVYALSKRNSGQHQALHIPVLVRRSK